MDNVNFEDPVLSSRVNNIKGKVDYIERNFKDKNLQLEQYVNNINHLKNEFSKVVTTVQNKDGELLNKVSEIDRLNHDNNLIKNERDE